MMRTKYIPDLLEDILTELKELNGRLSEAAGSGYEPGREIGRIPDDIKKEIENADDQQAAKKRGRKKSEERENRGEAPAAETV